MNRTSRRPLNQVEQLRQRAYDMSGIIRHRLNKAQNALGDEGLQILKDPKISAYIIALVEHQANFDAVVLLDWLVGEGLNDARYRKYFTEHDELELFMPATVTQPDEVKDTVSAIDVLRRDERYDMYNLLERDYTEDTIDHWIRRFWKALLSSQGNDDAYHTIYIDLTAAIDSLSPTEKRLIELLCEGHSLKEIGTIIGTSSTMKMYTNAKKNMVKFLRGEASA